MRPWLRFLLALGCVSLLGLMTFGGVARIDLELFTEHPAAGVPAHAELVTYPGPDGIPASNEYAVTVMQDGIQKDSFVYLVHAQKPDSNRSKSTSWTTFSLSGAVTVSVKKLQGSFQTCKILPTSRGITPIIHGDTVEFALDRPAKIAVEFDGHITHPMLVFADPLEDNIPSPNDPNVIYFGPGVHDIGAGFTVESGKMVYIAGGAYVKGQLTGEDRRNVSIRGRGILSGENLTPGGPHLIHLYGPKTQNALVEGITMIQAAHYNVLLSGRGNTVRNVKMISWLFCTDGVGVGRDGLVEDCFFKVNDDSIKLYQSNMTVRRCVIWQLENGAPFQISWNMPTDNAGFRISDCDVIRCEHRWNNRNCAIFDAIHGGPGHMSDYVFENIRIENAHWRLVRLTMEKTKWSIQHKDYGQISQLVFRNVTVDGSMANTNIIRGHDREHRISNVLFENVKVDGKCLTSAEDGNFEIDPQSADGIRFVAAEEQRGEGIENP